MAFQFVSPLSFSLAGSIPLSAVSRASNLIIERFHTATSPLTKLVPNGPPMTHLKAKILKMVPSAVRSYRYTSAPAVRSTIARQSRRDLCTTSSPCYTQKKLIAGTKSPYVVGKRHFSTSRTISAQTMMSDSDLAHLAAQRRTFYPNFG